MDRCLGQPGSMASVTWAWAGIVQRRDPRMSRTAARIETTPLVGPNLDPSGMRPAERRVLSRTWPGQLAAGGVDVIARVLRVVVTMPAARRMSAKRRTLPAGERNGEPAKD